MQSLDTYCQILMLDKGYQTIVWTPMHNGATLKLERLNSFSVECRNYDKENMDSYTKTSERREHEEITHKKW